MLISFNKCSFWQVWRQIFKISETCKFWKKHISIITVRLQNCPSRVFDIDIKVLLDSWKALFFSLVVNYNKILRYSFRKLSVVYSPTYSSYVMPFLQSNTLSKKNWKMRSSSTFFPVRGRFAPSYRRSPPSFWFLYRRIPL